MNNLKLLLQLVDHMLLITKVLLDSLKLSSGSLLLPCKECRKASMVRDLLLQNAYFVTKTDDLRLKFIDSDVFLPREVLKHPNLVDQVFRLVLSPLKFSRLERKLDS